MARAQRPGLRLRLIGASPDGDDRPWRRLADELGVADGVSIEPALDRAGVGAAMRRAGLFVHASPFETFGMVAAEALASGLPVVASPSGGVESIVGSDGTAGEATFRPEVLRLQVEASSGAPYVARQTIAAYAGLIGRDRARRPTAAGSVPAPVRRAIGAVVALHRSGAARVAALPDRARAGLTVVTNRAPARDLDASVARVVSPPAGASRSPSALARLGRSLTRRAAEPTPDGGRAAPEIAAIRSVAGAADAPDPAWIVAADADDVGPIVDAVGVGALAPGSIRWLADRSDELAHEPLGAAPEPREPRRA